MTLACWTRGFFVFDIRHNRTGTGAQNFFPAIGAQGVADMRDLAQMLAHVHDAAWRSAKAGDASARPAKTIAIVEVGGERP